MFLSQITALKLIFIINQCTSTIVKDDYSSATGIIENEKDQIININSNLVPEQDWIMPTFPGKTHHHYHMFSNRNDMFTVDPECDDGKTNITLDLNELISSTICFTKTFVTDDSIAPILHINIIPKAYVPPHLCMTTSLEYTDPMISFGAHRPLWGQYGEYQFIPKQRWMHNLEHGAIVMLYHPCAHPLVVDQLRKLVTSCLRRHIIAPYVHLSKERPLALYAWGKYLSMNVVDYITVTNFIKENALKGPEDIAKDGKYEHLLIQKAEPVSYPSDATICPHFPRD